eukprot:1141562_1
MGASFDLCEVNDSISSEQNTTDGSVVSQPTEDDKSNTKSSSDSEDAKDEDDDRNTKAETIQTTNQSTQTEEETETKTNASSSWWPRSWTDTQNKSKQKQKRLQTDYDKCQKELKELNTHIATLRNKVTESTKQMNQLQRENNRYQSAMLDQNTKIEQHEDTIANQKKELHDVKQQLRQQTRDTKAKTALLQTKNQALNQLQREIETTNSEHQSAMMKRKTQIKQHEVTIANKNTELQDSKEEVMELSTLLSGRDRNIATLKDKVAKQTKEMNQLQRENTKYQKAMLAQNTQIKQHEVTTATQHSEIQALQTHKSRLWLVLILSLICLPIFIGYSYQFHAQVQHLRERLVMDDQSCTIDQSYKIDQLNVMNTDLQQRATKNKQSIQMYKGQVATLDTKIVTLKDEIAQCEKDIQYKNSNYDDLTQEYQTCQNEAGKVKDLEEKIEEITRKMHDFEVDYEYCELEKAQMTEINKQKPQKRRGGVTTADDWDKIKTLNEKREKKEEEVFAFLEDNHLDVFKDVCKKEKKYLDDLKSSNTTHIAQLLHRKNHNKSTTNDYLRLKSCIIKLKNDVNIIYTDNKNLAIKRSTRNLLNEEKEILEQMTNEQLKMQDFIDIMLNIINQTDNAYNAQAKDIHKHHSEVYNRLQTRQKDLSASLAKWRHEKMNQLSSAVDDVELYVTNLQKALNQSYKYIDDKHLVSRERKKDKVLSQKARALSKKYPRYQNLSQFSVYVNDVASSVLFDALSKESLIGNIDQFGSIMSDNISVIPSIKLDRIVPLVSRPRTKIIWHYTPFNEYGIPYSNNTICNEINLYVENTLVEGWRGQVNSRTKLKTSCRINIDNDVLARVTEATNAPHDLYTFRIEYEMLSPIKVTVSDQMTNERNVLQTFLTNHELSSHSHIFENKEVHLNDILAFNGSVNQILDMKSMNISHIFDKTLFVASMVKWKSDQNVKITRKTLFELSNALKLTEKEQSTLDSVQKEQIKMIHFLQILLTITSNTEQTRRKSEAVIDDAFNTLMLKRNDLLTELDRMGVNKLKQIRFTVNAVEEYNVYLQNRFSRLFEYIKVNKRRDSSLHQETVNPFYSSEISETPHFTDYINEIGSDISFDDSALRRIQTMDHFGEFKLQKVYIIPVITIGKVEEEITEDGKVYRILWKYEYYEGKNCSSIRMYIDDVERTVESKLVHVRPKQTHYQKKSGIVATVCNASISGISLPRRNEIYTFKIEHSLDVPLRISIFDTYSWNHPFEQAESFFSVFNVCLIISGVCVLAVVCAYAYAYGKAKQLLVSPDSDSDSDYRMSWTDSKKMTVVCCMSSDEMNNDLKMWTAVRLDYFQHC